MQRKNMRKNIVAGLMVAGFLVLTAAEGFAGAKSFQAAADEYKLAEASNDDRANAPIVIQKVEPAEAYNITGLGFNREKSSWLGVAVDEAPEVLSAQLGLDPGVWLVVKFVETNSPAADVGLQKNDVLVEFNGQPLVHPAQLRKLVRVRKDGDTVKLVYYRGGKKENVSAKLATKADGFGWSGDGIYGLTDAAAEDFNRGAITLRNSLSNVHIDQDKVQDEVRRSTEAARRAIEDAMRQTSKASASLGPMLQQLQSNLITVDNDASITVRDASKSAKSLVKADDSGTIVIVKNPKLHLTIHDQDGKLLFDGEIETDEQRAEVPRDLWKKVEPLVKKMSEKSDNGADSN
jgi:hypothetical protein